MSPFPNRHEIYFADSAYDTFCRKNRTSNRNPVGKE